MEEEYDELVKGVVKRLAENNLYIKPEKCKWKIKKVKFLGVIIGPEGIKMKVEKVKGVLDWPTLQGVKDIQKFLGLANYYHWFIKDFTVIARLLHNIIRKNWEWKQTKKQETVFRKLKECFTREPVLAVPDLDKKMRMKVNASDYTIGEVLSMEYENRKQKLVAFLSKSLNETERNYEIYNKEMLAVIRGLENWRHLLEGAKFKFEIWMDHKNLEYFIKVQKLNKWQACQALYLSRFDFTLKYIPDIKIGKMDRLSRRLDSKVGVEKNNDNQIFIKN